MSSGVLGLLGFPAGCASVLIAGRWPTTPMLFGVAVMFATVGMIAVARWWFGRVPGGWIGQLALLLGFVLLSAGAARYLSRITPEEAFRQAFDCTLPPGVKLGTACYQHFDGGIVCLDMTAGSADLTASLRSRHFEAHDPLFESFESHLLSWPEFWHLASSPWVQIAKPGWPDPPVMKSPHYYVWRSDSYGTVDFVQVIWDANDGRAFVIYVHG